MILLLSLFMSWALAANAVELEAVSTVGHGSADPSVTFVGGSSGQIDVSLSCSGRRFTLSVPISAGSRDTLALSGLPKGEHRCTGKLDLQTADGGTGQMPLNLTVRLLGPINLKVNEADLDLEARSMLLRSDRPIKEVQVDVYGGQAGERIGGTFINGDGMTQLPIDWVSEGEILKITATVTDTFGIQSVLTLLPWSYAIPHDDVVFDTSQAALQPAELPKLEAAWGHIETTLAKYGDIVDMELFVAGYTDSQGDAGSNRALSLRRARSIAGWFRERGFTRPIWIQGFGEDGQAVPTADGVDEQANRRALYILAARKPSTSHDIPRSNWQKL